MASQKIEYVVSKRPRPTDCGWGNSGPFVVRAASPVGAVRMVRNRWKAYLTDHVRCETHILDVCEPGAAVCYSSDRVGKLLDY